MIALPIISIICCFAYIFYIVFKYNVPVSISETYYLLPNKLDWLFSAWCALTAVPAGFYWYSIAPSGLKWIPIVVAVAVTMIGVSCRYKSTEKQEGGIVRGNQKESLALKDAKSFKEFLKELLAKFNPKEFLQYGWARPIHYVASLLAITLCTVYICIVNKLAIPSVILSYITFIIIGMKVNGTYNKNYSTDVDNKSWIFFMEVVCFIQIFIFMWTA